MTHPNPTPTGTAMELMDELEIQLNGIGHSKMCDSRSIHTDPFAGEKPCNCVQSKAKTLRARIEAESTPCIWKEDSTGDYWSGSCDADWCFEADGPEENGMNFCPKCGHPVKVEKPEPEIEDEE